MRRLERTPATGRRDQGGAGVAGSALEYRAIDDLHAQHMPVGKARGVAVLTPQAQRHRDGVRAFPRFFPVPQFGALEAVSARKQERPFLGEPLEGGVHQRGLHRLAT